MKQKILALALSLLMVVCCVPRALGEGDNVHLLWDIPFGASSAECKELVLAATGIELLGDQHLYQSVDDETGFELYGQPVWIQCVVDEAEGLQAIIVFFTETPYSFSTGDLADWESGFDTSIDFYHTLQSETEAACGPATGGFFMASKNVDDEVPLSFHYPLADGKLDDAVVRACLTENDVVALYAATDNVIDTYVFTKVGEQWTEEPFYEVQVAIVYGSPSYYNGYADGMPFDPSLPGFENGENGSYTASN